MITRISNTRMGTGQMVVQSNIYWLEAKFVDGNANRKLLCNMDSVDI